MRVIHGNPLQNRPRNNRRAAIRNERLENHLEQRLQRQEREMRIRKRENARIDLIRDRMNRIQNDMELNPEKRQRMLAAFGDQIHQIYTNRAKRERQEAEMEAKKQQMKMEAAIQEATEVRPQEAPEEEEEDEEAAQRENIRGLTRMAVSQDNITAFRQARASLSMEAFQLRRAIAFDTMPVHFEGGPGGADITFHVPAGGEPSDFRNQQLAKVNRGISRLDAAIHATISRMYRETAAWKEQMTEYSTVQDVREEEQEEEEAFHLDVNL